MSQRLRSRRGTWALVVALSLVAASPAAASTRTATIDHVTDGDTVVLSGGERVRLVQIDTPEVYGSRECYGAEASAETKSILSPGTRVRIVTAPRSTRRIATAACSPTSGRARAS